MTKHILITYSMFCLVATLSGGFPFQDKGDSKTNIHGHKHHLSFNIFRRRGALTGTSLKRSLDAVDTAGFGRLHKRNFDEIDRAGFNDFHKRSLDEIDRAGSKEFSKRSAFDKNNWVDNEESGNDHFYEAESLRLSKRNFDEISRSGFGRLISYHLKEK
ncbi:orcokinin peptides type A-like [Limulus polyphemus]|uniref:Orcokinin peptides type A-like n=1 Tax=Limulus polyphemus TaxID=6850 RepID=A0ABM1BIF8_LIMPO|nr:orcokinin peptides type A-like [Limulus polyphemus]